MNYKDYLKDHWLSICIEALFLVTLLIFGGLTQIPLYFLVITGVGSFLLGLGLLCWDYGRKKEFYEELREKVRDLDKAYLLPEILSEPEFLEGRLACQAMKEMGRSMAERVSSYEQKQKEYKEYIELWVHEIKLPIATGKLLVENNRQFYDESMMYITGKHAFERFAHASLRVYALRLYHNAYLTVLIYNCHLRHHD